jgi:hypothetical protein
MCIQVFQLQPVGNLRDNIQDIQSLQLKETYFLCRGIELTQTGVQMIQTMPSKLCRFGGSNS